MSGYSHRGLLHLIMNCLALEGFGETLQILELNVEAHSRLTTGSAAYYFLVREQAKQQPPMLESTSSFHFLAFFVSGGYSKTTSLDATTSQFVQQLVSSLV